MARLDFSNLKHRLLTYGFLLGSASVLTADWSDPKTAAVKVSAGAVGGVALDVLKSVSGEVFGGDWHAKLSERIGDESAFLKNHDLTEAVGLALSVSIRFASRHASADSPLRGCRDVLRVMAKEAPENWMRVAEEQSAEFAPLLESGMPEIFTRQVTEWADAEILSPDVWEILLPKLAWGGNLPDRFGYVPPEAISALAAELPRLFPRALREVIKHDAANGGKAYPSLLLLMVGEFGATLKAFWKESRAAHAATHEKLDELLARLPTLTTSEVKRNVPGRNLPFIAAGRGQEFRRAVRALNRNGRAAITGMGGMGKTRLAIEIANRRFDNYPDGIAWVGASGSLEEGFRTAAFELGWPEATQSDATVFRAQIRHRLAGWSRGLLILDNADDVTDLLAWLPENLGCHALLTLRPEGRIEFTEVRLTSLFPEDGATMLLARLGKSSFSESDREEARNLSEDLGGLPLALTQAAAYIASTKETFARYREIFAEESERAALLQGDENRPLYDHDPVYTTFALSFRKLTDTPKTPETERKKNTRLAAADLLRMMAFLAPNAIPVELFSGKSAEVLGEPVALVAESKTHWNETVTLARHLALLEFDAEKKEFSIHRLIQAILRAEAGVGQNGNWEEGAVNLANRTIALITQSFPGFDFIHWTECARLTPHGLTCIAWIDAAPIVTESSALLMDQLGFYLHSQGRYVEAEPLFRDALKFTKRILSADHPDIATCMNNLAELYESQGRYVEAEPLYRDALEFTKRVLPVDHPVIATSMNNLAGLYESQGRYVKAEPLYRDALDIFQKALPGSHPNLAILSDNLAECLKALGKTEEAAKYRANAAEIRARHEAENRRGENSQA